MPKSVTKKNKVNRNKTLKNIQTAATDKAWFRIPGTKKEFPGQLIQLYYSSLQNDFPGQILKELDPKEYVKQKQKLQVAKNLKTRRYNYGPRTPPGTPPRRGPGSRGSRSSGARAGSLLKKANESFANWLERMEKE